MTEVANYSQVKRLEGLAHSMQQAVKRNRRGLTLHRDELPALIEVINLAARTIDANRVAEIQTTNRENTNAE